VRVWLAVLAVALMVVPGAAAQTPFGALTQLAGPGGCVERGNKGDGCAKGRGLYDVHSVVISPDGRFLYSGAGSIADPPGDDGAIGVFSVKTKTGGIAQLGATHGCVKNPKAIEGVDGCAVARNIEGMRFVNISPGGRFLYTGSYFGMSVFRRNPVTGLLSQLPGRAGCFRSDGAEGCTNSLAVRRTEDIRFTRDGRFVYTANNGFDSIVIFKRDPKTGRLTQLPGKTGCLAYKMKKKCTIARGMESPRGITLSPDQRLLYLAALDDSIVIFKRNPVTGRLTQLPGPAGCITERRRDGCALGRGIYSPHKLTFTKDGRFAYVAGKRGSDRGSAISVWKVDPATGHMQQFPGREGCISEFIPSVPPLPEDIDDGCAPGRIVLGAHVAVLDREERTLYVASDQDQGGVAIFRRNPTTGTIRQLPGTWGCIAPTAAAGCATARRQGGLHYLVLSPDQRFAYAAGENAEAVVAYRRAG
jgi:6-phosphogluconolactonase (cycloisomerase 2 family)